MPRASLCRLQPCGDGVVAGALRMAPPTETGPTKLGCRVILLRIVRDSRLRACFAGMDEVTSEVIAFFSASTFAISKRNPDELVGWISAA